MALSVVRTGNVALDRFLDEVRRKIDTLESTTKVIRIGGSGAGGGNSLTTAETAHIEKLAREITDSRLAQELRKPIDTKRVQGAVDDLRSEVRSRIDQVKADLLGGFQAGIDATVIQEINDRTAAIEAEAIARADSIAAEAHTRLLQVQEVANSALDALTAVHQETTDRQAAVALARSDLQTYTDGAVAAEATQRTLLAAQILGADGTSNTTGLIYDERTARVTQDNALAQQITLLSAGAGEQFDWKKIWYFDSSVESWTGVSPPTTAAGWLRPANGAPAVTSPAGLAIDGNQYGQIRFRVRKFGTLTWNGTIAWNGGSAVATEPTYDSNGIGLVTISPNWTGTIDYISIAAYTTQDSTNRFEIDWVAVGRPSPGASSAQLLEEQTVRAAADSAEVTARQALSSKLTGLNDPSAATLASLTSGLMYDERVARTTADSAQVTSINNLQASLTTLDGEVSTLTSSVTTIETAVAKLDSTTASTTTEVISLGRTFDSELDQSAEALLRDIIATDNERKNRISEIALARSDLTTKIVDGLSAESAARLLLEARVGTTEADIISEQTARTTADSALASDITLLTTRMGTAEADIISEQTARSTADSAFASDLTALTTRVGAAEADIINEQTARSSADEAFASDLTALTTRVDTAEADILTEATARATGDSANAELITTLTSRVDTAEEDIAAVEITAGTAATKAGDLEGKFTVKVTAGNHVAGFGLAASSNMADGSTSSFIVQADKFGIVSTDGSTSRVPFSVNTLTGKVVFQSDVAIDGNLLVTGTVTNAGLADATIEGGKIKDGAVGTTKIADAAITNAKISDLDASKITAGTISADRIGAGSISADKLAAGAITADMITSGNLALTGGNLTTYGGLVYATGNAGAGNGAIEAQTAGETGVKGWSTASGGRGVLGYASNTGGVGVHGWSLSGPGVRCTGSLQWGSYTWSSPTGSTSLFMRADGNWASPSWSDVTDKPTTFTPSTHTHDYTTPTDVSNSIAANNVTATAAVQAYYASGRTITIPGVGTFTNCSIT